jgi:acetyl esterase/lipase
MEPHDFSDIVAARAKALAARSPCNVGVPSRPDLAIRLWEAGALCDVGVRQYTNILSVSPRPALVWVHGGGHVLGHIDQEDPALQALCGQVGCDVFAVALRRAPEHPFPAPAEDVYGALTAVIKEAQRLGVDPTRIALGGSSAGGGTAAGVALMVRDRGELELCYQMLVYPMLDDRNIPPRSPEVIAGVWTGESNAYGWRSYLGNAVGADDVPPYAAPARAADLSGLPPAFIAVGDLDLFFAEDLAYATRLDLAAVPVEVHSYPGAYHGFNNVAPHAAVSRRFFRDRDEALQRALTPTMKEMA